MPAKAPTPALDLAKRPILAPDQAPAVDINQKLAAENWPQTASVESICPEKCLEVAGT